jgi:hypothetical protein
VLGLGRFPLRPPGVEAVAGDLGNLLAVIAATSALLRWSPGANPCTPAVPVGRAGRDALAMRAADGCPALVALAAAAVLAGDLGGVPASPVGCTAGDDALRPDLAPGEAGAVPTAGLRPAGLDARTPLAAAAAARAAVREEGGNLLGLAGAASMLAF